MGLFRKKPVMIEAVKMGGIEWFDGLQFAVQFDEPDGLPKWLRDALLDGDISAAENDFEHLSIQTLEGVMLVSPGDWIIRGVKGEIYPCKPDIFAMTYDPVDEQDVEVTGVAI
jgi:hypothetical protein